MQEPLSISTEETPEEILLKQQTAKKLKRKINKYRNISIFSTLICSTALWIICSNVSVIEVLILSLPLLGTAIFGYLAAEDTLKEKSKGRTLLQVVLTFLIALGIGFATKSSSNQQSLRTRAERDSLQQVSDSTISRKVTDSVKKIYDGISKSFSGQGLKLDSLTFALSKLNDSTKTIIMNTAVKDPSLNIYNGNIFLERETSDSLIFKVGLTCETEPAKNIKLFYIAEVDYTIGNDAVKYDRLNFDALTVGSTWGTDLAISKKAINIKTIGFLFFGQCRGPYPNSKDVKIEPILYIYNISTKWATRYTGPTKQSWVDKYRKQGFDL